MSEPVRLDNLEQEQKPITQSEPKEPSRLVKKPVTRPVAPVATTTTKPKLDIPLKKIAVLVGVVLVTAGLVMGGVIAWQSVMNQQDSSEQLQEYVESETASLIEKISEQIKLPNETPVLMIVSDASLIEDEAFKHAQDGDKVLRFEEAGIFVIYRESTGEIITKGKTNSGPADSNVAPTGVAE